MSFARAVVFLWAASARNRVRQQLQRLKQPKYLVGALVGLAYFYSLALRRYPTRNGAGPVPPGVTLVLELALSGLLVVALLAAWTFGPDQPSLSFSESEVQQLLPAPVSRRALLRYKLVRGFFGGAAGVLVATFFAGRASNNPRLLFMLGSLVALAVVYLHATGASLVRAKLAEWGWPGLVLRWGLVLALVGAGVAGGYAALRAHPLPEDVKNLHGVEDWLTGFLQVPGVAVVAWPVRVLVELPLSPDVGTFLQRLPWVLGLLGLHYAWVVSIRVPFEESAVLRGEARARERSLRAEHGWGRPGGRMTLRAALFRLKPVGRPEVALLWKNFIAGRRLGGVDAILHLVLLCGVGLAVLFFVSENYFAAVRLIVSPLSLLLVCFLALGPSSLRAGLRGDLRKLDLLRALPLKGWQVVGAELLAPALMLGGLEVLLILFSVVLGWGLPLPGTRGPEGWLVGGLTATVVMPAVTLASLLVQNAMVVLFPAWLPPEGERVRGFEAMGQRLLTLVGTVLVLVVGLVPASIAAAVVGFALYWLLGLTLWALPFAGLAAAVVLTVQVGFGVLALGRAFDMLDVSGEGPDLVG